MSDRVKSTPRRSISRIFWPSSLALRTFAPASLAPASRAPRRSVPASTAPSRLAWLRRAWPSRAFMSLAPARFALDRSASNNKAPVMSAPRKSAHLASIRLRSASTSFAPERSARCSVLRNNVASLRSASFKITRSSFTRLKSRALRSRPDRSHAMQDFVVPARNASTSAANPDAAIPTQTPSAMPNFILPAGLPAILGPSRRCRRLHYISRAPPRVGWAKRSVPTATIAVWRWARFALPTLRGRRRAPRRLGLRLLLWGRLEARQRLQPFDDGAVVGPVAEFPFCGAPGRKGRVDQRRTRVGRNRETRGQIEIATHKSELNTGFEPPGDHVPPQRRVEVAAAELVAEIEDGGRLESEALAEPDRLARGQEPCGTQIVRDCAGG